MENAWPGTGHNRNVDEAVMSNLLLKLAALSPPGIKRFIYRRPRLLRPLARALKRAVPSDGSTIEVPRGPLRGMKLEVDRATPNYYWLNDSYEPQVEKLLLELIEPGMHVADVGAHIGFDTMLMSRAVGEAGKVIAFEPDPANMVRLKRNVELNALKNVTLIENAVSDRFGTARFVARGDATSHLDAGEAETGFELSLTTIDQASRASRGSISSRSMRRTTKLRSCAAQRRSSARRDPC
jgi:FkbM family methyltransferase